MSHWLRLAVMFKVLIGLAVLGILYATAGQQLLALVKPGQQFSGFMSSTVANIETVVPLVIAVLALGFTLWYIVSTVRQERTVEPRRPRR
jgi:hypothetical protein